MLVLSTITTFVTGYLNLRSHLWKSRLQACEVQSKCLAAITTHAETELTKPMAMRCGYEEYVKGRRELQRNRDAAGPQYATLRGSTPSRLWLPSCSSSSRAHAPLCYRSVGTA